MNFLVNMFNHNTLGQRSLEDVVGIFGKQLRALGHNIIWDTANDKWIHGQGNVNIVVEGFTKGSIEIIKNAHAQGARFIYLATEEPTPKGFNHGYQKEMVFRQQTFVEAAKYCEAIFYLVPGKHVYDFYSQFAPASYVELGYAPNLVRPQLVREPQFEFGFYGSLSERRLKILKKLAARLLNTPKAVRIVADFSTQEARDKEMQNCKIILQLRKFEKMGLVSSSRCNTALHLGRAVICEPHDLSKPWDEVVMFARSLDEFFANCLVWRNLWRQLWNDQFSNFKTKMSPEYCVGRCFSETRVLDRLLEAA